MKETDAMQKTHKLCQMRKLLLTSIQVFLADSLLLPWHLGQVLGFCGSG
jgi:hypothetical protein